MPVSTSDPQMMMDWSHHPSVPHNMPSPYYFLGTHPRYDWTAPDILSSFLQLDRNLFSTDNILSDEGRRELIEAYPALRNVEYRAPVTLPAVHKLDILGHELLQSSGVPDMDLERHLNMLNNARTLLVNACATVIYSRNKIVMHAVNPHFSAPDPSASKRYTMASEDFLQEVT
ncbi:hypothetical protein G6F70_008826 [Rhizopus microsporus]|uniref:Uncharacterized protein n=1 Tax=Rhizopus azygosporus TaxID=86630 RepID=A0A367K603_RHIAZ|nr:hypothetical protein G6F71_007133 [Rhizopus microsporus]KAG1194520.1 hypothetical protein G6F70_008826 [Rhizopus microsporus]KAG1208575.1 hypothetical protein G6F69_007091 [Rhizopus microsporus]RCH97644.1 hypothetical protein CU097_009331 [Rhizopus azygosporus]